MNCLGNQNDRTAFKFSGFHKLFKDIPDGYYILSDAAYPAPDKVLVPFPGTNLSPSQDSYNSYQSQARMAIEQTFGILVRFRYSGVGFSMICSQMPCLPSLTRFHLHAVVSCFKLYRLGRDLLLSWGINMQWANVHIQL